MQEVLPGVYQLPIPIPNPSLGFVNAYLIRGDGEVMLIDAGWNTPDALDALYGYFRALGLGFRNLTHLVITHVHPDHYGLAGKIQELSGAELILHRVEKAFIESRYLAVDNLVEEVTEWLRINGVALDEISPIQRSTLDMLALVAPARPDRTLAGGEVLEISPFHFEVLWTPGHSPGHICLYERARRVLITGDHLLPTVTPNIPLHPQSFPNPLGDYLDSLATIEALPTEFVLPGHGSIFADVGKRVEEICRHTFDRAQRVWDAIGDGEASGYAIASRVPWKGGSVSWEELPGHDRRAALQETLAHLEKLRAEGKVDKVVRGSVVHYARGHKRPSGEAEAGLRPTNHRRVGIALEDEAL